MAESWVPRPGETVAVLYASGSIRVRRCPVAKVTAHNVILDDGERYKLPELRRVKGMAVQMLLPLTDPQVVKAECHALRGVAAYQADALLRWWSSTNNDDHALAAIRMVERAVQEIERRQGLQDG